MKKLLMLGGSRLVIPAIQSAHELGYYVITCDYMPENAGHKYADEYHNISIVEREKVLALADSKSVDGIMSFATDPGVVVAAWVCERLGLPTSPYASVAILQDKERFRGFLKKHGFNVPFHKAYSVASDALRDIELFRWPVMVKPVDSAGSKGVSRIDSPAKLSPAICHALRHSLCGRFIIEEFVEKEGASSDSDCFSVDGVLKFISFNGQLFDSLSPNPYTPASYIWPSDRPKEVLSELASELQRLISLLNMGTTLYNIETRQGTDGKAYIMEVSPRAGGNRLAEVLRYATGVDLIGNAVRAAVGEPIDKIPNVEYKGYWVECILHSNVDGIFQSVEIRPEIRRNNLVEEDVWVRPGEKVRAFWGANDAIGTAILRFDTRDEMNKAINDIDAWLKVIVA